MIRLFPCVFLLGCIQGICATPTIAKPPPDPPARIVASGISGSLVICGGGKFPEEAGRRFLKLAGGSAARCVRRVDPKRVHPKTDPGCGSRGCGPRAS